MSQATVKQAKKGERLDQIIYKEYGSLEQEIVNKVLSSNKHLLTKIELAAGDKVYLPNIQIKKPKGKYLW